MPDTEISRLLDSLRYFSDCSILPVEGLPTITGYSLPQDLIEFYSLCGGLILYENAPAGINIVGPHAFLPANPVIIGEDLIEEARMLGAILPDISDHWFVLGNGLQDFNSFVTIDLANQRVGRCYDSSLGRHANPNYSTIIAISFTDFLSRSIASNGQDFYWHDSFFESYGDAYDKDDIV